MRRHLPSAFLPLAHSRKLAFRYRRIVIGTVIGFTITLGLVTSSVFLIACAVGSGEAFHPVAIDKAVKPIGEFRRDVKAFIQNSKEIEHRSTRFGAIVDLCLLHDQIVNDPRYQTNGRLQGLRATAADRLKKCCKQIELEMVRAKREAEKQNEPTRQESNRDPSRYDSLIAESPIESELDFETYNRWLIEEMYSISRISGGPIQIWHHVGGNFSGPLCDFGPDLVRLIETTIDPDSWRSNGGAGVIYYYQPLRILVVNASSRVHDDLTDMLQTLRTNSR